MTVEIAHAGRRELASGPVAAMIVALVEHGQAIEAVETVGHVRLHFAPGAAVRVDLLQRLPAGK